MNWIAITALAFMPSPAATSCSPDSAGYNYDPRSGKANYYRTQGSSAPVVRRLPKVDGASFEALLPKARARQEPPNRRVNSGTCPPLVHFARDRVHVFYQGGVMEGADPMSFEFLDFVYTRDKNAVYSGGKRLTTRVKEFRVLPYPLPRYATDGERYFYGDIILPETELEFYGPVKGSAYDYARSKTRVYDRGREIVGADADTFTMELVGIGITKDKNNVYYQNRPIPNADPASFVVVRIGLFEDKRAFYECPHDRCSERPK